MKRILFIFIVIILSSFVFADAIVEDGTEDNSGQATKAYKIDVSNAEYLEINFTTELFEDSELASTPAFAPAESSLIFDADKGIASATVYVYWIYAASSDKTISVKFSATELSNSTDTIPFKFTIKTSESTSDVTYTAGAADIELFSNAKTKTGGAFSTGFGNATVDMEATMDASKSYTGIYTSNLAIEITAN